MNATDTPSFDTIKETHERLSNELREACSSAKPFDGNEDGRTAFLQNVDVLLTQIKAAAPKVRTRTEYNYLNNATAFWKLAFSKILEVSKSVHILSPPESYDLVLSEDTIKSYLDEEANKVSLTRRLDKAMSRIRNAVISDFVETTDSEKDNDWLAAEIYFASDILLGSGKLWEYIKTSEDDKSTVWRYFTDSTFDWSARVWLRDVIKLQAYMNWLKNHHRIISDIETRNEYVKACRAITERVSKSDIKCNVPEDKSHVVLFLKNRFLKKDSYKIDEGKEFCGKLIRRKANRIAELNRSSADMNDANWFRAVDYTTCFYEHVCQSILDEGDLTNRKELIRAFELSEKPVNNSSVMDCFEAMLLIYYVPNLTLPDVWG